MHQQSPTVLITPPEPPTDSRSSDDDENAQIGHCLSPTKRSDYFGSSDNEKRPSGWDKIFSKPLQRSKSAGSRADIKGPAANGMYSSLAKRKSAAQKTQLSADDANSEESSLSCDDKGRKGKDKKSIFDVKEVFNFFHRKSTHDLTAVEGARSLVESRSDNFGGSQGNLSSIEAFSSVYPKQKKHSLYPHHDSKSSKHGGPFPGIEKLKRWEISLEHLLADRYGLALFNAFLKTEYSDENLEFWMACESYKSFSGHKKLYKEAQKIYSQHLSVQAPREVNLDSKTRLQTISSLGTPSKLTFDSAQKRIYALMEKDSYPRFLRSEVYQLLVREAVGPGPGSDGCS